MTDANPGAGFDPSRLEAIRAQLSNTRPTPNIRPAPPPPAAMAPRVPEAATNSKTGPGSVALWQRAAILTLAFTALLYFVEFVDGLTDHRLDQAGIQPRSVAGLWGILFAPVLHGSWDHLAANTLPLVVLGFLVLMSGIARGLWATAIIWVVGGIGTWLTGGAHTLHIGASVLIFGWLTFLLIRGWFTRSVMQIFIGVVVFVFYGSLLWGVLPGAVGVSWQGHLFGAIGGVAAAWVLSGDERARRRRKRTGDRPALPR